LRFRFFVAVSEARGSLSLEVMMLFPEAPPRGTSALPAAATFWMPKPDEIDEEGFGYFRDTWLIKDVPVREAREIMVAERRIAEVIGELAATQTILSDWLSSRNLVASRTPPTT
jgi:hypothetical protein